MRTSRNIVFIVGGLTAGLFAVAAFFAWSSTAGTGKSEQRDPGLLLTGDRSRLRACVADLTGGASAAGAGPVQDALDGLTAHPNWQAAGLSAGPPQATAGCGDVKPFLLAPGVTYENGGFSSFSGFPEVKEASPYRVMVFVLPAEQIASMFADSPARSVAQEMQCQGGQCAEVTTGLYVTEKELESEALKRWLAVAVGLEQPDLPAGGDLFGAQP